MTTRSTDALSEYSSRLDSWAGVLIGGHWKPGSGGIFAVEDPATTEAIAHVSNGTATNAKSAAMEAAGQFPSWSATAPRTRSDLLSGTRDLMLRDAELLAALISAESGKSLADARAEVTYAAEFFRWYAEEAIRPHGDFGSSPVGGHKGHRDPQASRRCCPRHAIEFPRGHGHPQGRPDHRRRVHCGSQARRRDPAHGPRICAG